MTWQAHAACRSANTDIFFPEHGESDAEAKAICATCPVKNECLAWAVAEYERGIWGGTSERRRSQLRSGRQMRRTVQCQRCDARFTFVSQPGRPPGYCETCQPLIEREWRQRYDAKRHSDPGSAPGLTIDRGGHGTISRYHSGCRCQACRRASREQRAAYRARAS